MDKRSMSSDVKPLPVPPPNEWKTRNPWSPWHCSVRRRIRSLNGKRGSNWGGGRGASERELTCRRRSSLVRRCIDRERSCWRRPPSRLGVAQDGTASCKCRYGSHLKRHSMTCLGTPGGTQGYLTDRSRFEIDEDLKSRDEHCYNRTSYHLTALGTCFPAVVSEKNVLNDMSSTPILGSLGI